MNKYKFIFLLGMLLFVSVNTSYSQLGGPPVPGEGEAGSGPGVGDDDVQDEIVPIDGLVFLGLVAGSIYGIRKKYYKKEA